MKFVSIIVAALVCTCFYFCQAENQNQEKRQEVTPLAHIVASEKGPTTYAALAVIKDWSPNSVRSHLKGGMTYNDGALTVPQSGRYYVYEKIYFMGFGRVPILVNGNTVNFAQNPNQNEATVQVGSIISLKAGDVISLRVSRWKGTASIKIYMSRNYSCFGAFLIP